jgi:fructose-1,6-bisphosphatase I
MDVFANNQLTGVLRHGISCAGVASEELESCIAFEDSISKNSKYICVYDPLDGSGNIDVNISIGTIFGIYRRISPPGTPVTLDDFLQPGIKQIAAGYIVYGSSTMFVYATRRGVNGFTLDPATGEFCLSHPDIHCPKVGDAYSVNHGNFFWYDKGVQNYINFCQQNDNKHYTQRYTGSMAADVHRTLIKGGIFMYPGTTSHPNGKLRLLYECNPFAFITEIAGGRATNGKQRILEIIPSALHQRSPLFIGSAGMMDKLETFLP